MTWVLMIVFIQQGALTVSAGPVTVIPMASQAACVAALKTNAVADPDHHMSVSYCLDQNTGQWVNERGPE